MGTTVQCLSYIFLAASSIGIFVPNLSFTSHLLLAKRSGREGGSVAGCQPKSTFRAHGAQRNFGDQTPH
jgi:hypothetical protein